MKVETRLLRAPDQETLQLFKAVQLAGLPTRTTHPVSNPRQVRAAQPKSPTSRNFLLLVEPRWRRSSNSKMTTTTEVKGSKCERPRQWPEQDNNKINGVKMNAVGGKWHIREVAFHKTTDPVPFWPTVYPTNWAKPSIKRPLIDTWRYTSLFDFITKKFTTNC